jgi:hypothetical protein
LLHILRFNATTAFLLPSTPPSRPPSARRFQCHHGVPASLHIGNYRWGCALVSMPPRRSCFLSRKSPITTTVVCFDATTAFLLQWDALDHAFPVKSFNATTAFLLPSKFTRVPRLCQRFNATTAFLLR